MILVRNFSFPHSIMAYGSERPFESLDSKLVAFTAVIISASLIYLLGSVSLSLFLDIFLKVFILLGGCVYNIVFSSCLFSSLLFFVFFVASF